MEIVPCSRVGHIYKIRQVYSYPGAKSPEEVTRCNTGRVAEVWLDEYKYLYDSTHNAEQKAAGEAGTLQCHATFIAQIHKNTPRFRLWRCGKEAKITQRAEVPQFRLVSFQCISRDATAKARRLVFRSDSLLHSRNSQVLGRCR